MVYAKDSMQFLHSAVLNEGGDLKKTNKITKVQELPFLPLFCNTEVSNTSFDLTAEFRMKK